MARNFHLAAETAAIKKLYAEFKERFGGDSGASVLGGWAAYELVDEVAAYESLDLDVLIRRTGAWGPAIAFFQDRGHAWRRLGRVNDQRLERSEDRSGVDVFYSSDVDSRIPQRLFGTRWAANLKNVACHGFVPSLESMLEDKFRTLPLRPPLDGDVKLKRLKDALDIYALLFRNRQGAPAERLLTGAVLEAARSCHSALVELAAREGSVGEIREILDALRSAGMRA